MTHTSEITGRFTGMERRHGCFHQAGYWKALSLIVGLISLTSSGGLKTVYAENAGTIEPGSRVIHFPKDRSLGAIKIQDAGIKRQIETFHHWIDGTSWEYLCEATGDVTVPVGKRVGLFVNKAAAEDLSPLSELRPDDLYLLRLPGSVASDDNADDRCMPHLAGLTGLKELMLQWTNITSKGMRFIKDMKSLECLCTPAEITDTGLRYVSQLPSLKRLYIKRNKLTNRGLRHLAKLPTLEELELGGKNIGDDGLVHLANLSSLRYLLLWGGFTDAGIVYLQKVPSLKIIYINSRQFSDVGLRHLAKLPNLENIGLHWIEGITDTGLTSLKQMPFLKKLDIMHSQVTDNGLAHLREIKSLEYLMLPSSGITERGLSYISNLTKLKYLWVAGRSNSPLTDTALQHVSKLHSLEYLLISGTGFTDAGIEHIAKLTNLRELILTANSVTDEGLVKLEALKSLEYLSLSCKKVTISGLSNLNALGNIVKLKVRNVNQDNSGLDISELTKLEKLTLTLKTTRKGKELFHDSVRDEDITCLGKLKNLKWFQIGYTKDSMITDAGTANLADLTNMERLTIGSAYLTDNTLAHLTNMKKLNFLRITGNFTDAGLRYLEGLKAIRHLKIYSANNFSSEALKRLKDNLPNLPYLTAEKNREIGKMLKANPKPPTVRRVAPLFAVKTLDGKEIKLADYRGKVVLLYFWGTWCKPCVAATPQLKKLYQEMKDTYSDDFEMISFSMDESEHKLRNYVKKNNLNWPQVRIGLSSRISSDYSVNDRAPVSFLIGPDGKMLLTPESECTNINPIIVESLKAYSSRSK